MLSQTATGRETNRIEEINTQEKKSLEIRKRPATLQTSARFDENSFLNVL